MGKYDLDFHAWSLEQADALRRRSGNEIDWENIAEEIESLGKRERAELESRYIVLLAHLLKWAYQPDGRGRSWENTIREQRRQIVKHLRENPSLKAVESEEYRDAYEGARLSASTEANMPVESFPTEPPFGPEEAKNAEFWPE